VRRCGWANPRVSLTNPSRVFRGRGIAHQFHSYAKRRGPTTWNPLAWAREAVGSRITFKLYTVTLVTLLVKHKDSESYPTTRPCITNIYSSYRCNNSSCYQSPLTRHWRSRNVSYGMYLDYGSNVVFESFRVILPALNNSHSLVLDTSKIPNTFCQDPGLCELFLNLTLRLLFIFYQN
jgi:hypothetical protein